MGGARFYVKDQRWHVYPLSDRSRLIGAIGIGALSVCIGVLIMLKVF
jgi:hypothetical protein